MIAVTSFLRLLALFLIPVAAAQDPCVGVPGGCVASNVLIDFLPAIAQLLVGVAGGGAVLMTVVGGAKVMLNFGDESKVDSGKQTIIYGLVGFGLVLGSQSIVAFIYRQAQGAAGPDPIVGVMAAAVGAILSLFNVIFVSMIMYAAIRMVIGRGKEDEYNKAKTMFIYVCIGAILINIAHAMVQAILRLGL